MKSLKICVVIVAEFFDASIEILDDKKIRFGELLGLLPHLAKIPKFITNLPLAIKEIREGVSDEYMSEIKNEVRQAIDVDNEALEVITEEIVTWLVLTFSSVAKFAMKKKK
ncbi:hypothetical protein EBZ38_05390 [bacterium]|nr:hypothetical protein [bacterium]